MTTHNNNAPVREDVRRQPQRRPSPVRTASCLQRKPVPRPPG